jgi:DNA-binding response OmpR family regulator
MANRTTLRCARITVKEQASLSGLRVLVVEDTFLIAMDLADQLADSGCEVVGPISTVKLALERIDGAELDGALLDVNLDGERSFPIAEFLAARGIPFIFLTGYDSQTVFPDEFQHAPRLAKPVDTKSLLGAITAHFGRKSTGDRVQRAAT